MGGPRTCKFAGPEMSEGEGSPRNKQLNLKVSEACKALFLAMVVALGTKNADPFEDMLVLKKE
jgi:hypothetical protein